MGEVCILCYRIKKFCSKSSDSSEILNASCVMLNYPHNIIASFFETLKYERIGV